VVAPIESLPKEPLLEVVFGEVVSVLTRRFRQQTMTIARIISKAPPPTPPRKIREVKRLSSSGCCWACPPPEEEEELLL
jgi:hypothetical protein